MPETYTAKTIAETGRIAKRTPVRQVRSGSRPARADEPVIVGDAHHSERRGRRLCLPGGWEPPFEERRFPNPPSNLFVLFANLAGRRGRPAGCSVFGVQENRFRSAALPLPLFRGLFFVATGLRPTRLIRTFNIQHRTSNVGC
jgi:hypothetical protein